MIGKIAYLLAVLATIVVAADPAPGSLHRIDRTNKGPHDLFVGYPVPGDRLVYNQQVLRQIVPDQVVTAQQTFYVSKYERITQVIARDAQMYDLGGYARLVNGGPGTSNATLYFWSQRGHAINFIVEIYAKR